MNIELFTPRRKPRYEKDLAGNDELFSVDVNVITEQGIHGLAFFNFDMDKWIFHTDMLSDLSEPQNKVKWWWYYPAVTKEDLPKYEQYEKD